MSETTGGVVSDASDALKNRLIDTGVDHVIDEGRQRLHRDEPSSEPPSAT